MNSLFVDISIPDVPHLDKGVMGAGHEEVAALHAVATPVHACHPTLELVKFYYFQSDQELSNISCLLPAILQIEDLCT